MLDSDQKDNKLKTLQGEDRRTTPYSSPAPSAAAAHFELGDARLAVLQERYDLLAELGRGGMGVVYRARDRETGDVVALKVLLPEIASHSDLIERFKSELLLARKITHKNVCRVYDFNRFGEVAAISMEYVEGESLRELLNRYESVSLRTGLEWIDQICSALTEAHNEGVIHRDLKPANILLAHDGTAKLMDFGIARSVNVDASHTATGVLVGTPAYMSPEQAQGKAADVRSDIYSLGLVMYEMFAGQPAFRADTPLGYVAKQLTENPLPLHSVAPEHPENLGHIISKCLHKRPEERYQSIHDLTIDLATLRVGVRKITPTAANGGEDDEPILLSRAFALFARSPRLWWQATQVMFILFDIVLVCISWKVKEWTPGAWGLALFFAVVVLAAAAMSFRIYLLGTAAVNPGGLPNEVRHFTPWSQRVDMVFAIVLFAMAASVASSHTAVAALLLGVSVATVLVFTTLEPALIRTAFPEISPRDTGLR